METFQLIRNILQRNSTIILGAQLAFLRYCKILVVLQSRNMNNACNRVSPQKNKPLHEGFFDLDS